jgi:hypothetical protein
MEFDKQNLLNALTQVGEILYQRGKIGDIAIYGGSALILQFDVSFKTEDVDAIINSEHGEVSRAVREVGTKNGWTSSWLNEGVSVYLSTDANSNTEFFRDFPSPMRIGLRVHLASPKYMLTLKLRSLRIQHRDNDDVVMLAKALGVTTLDELVSLMKANFPNEPVDNRKIILLGNLIGEITG